MPALGVGDCGVEGGRLTVVCDVGIIEVVGQSNCVICGILVQPQGWLVLVWTAYELSESPQTHQSGPLAMAAHVF